MTKKNIFIIQLLLICNIDLLDMIVVVCQEPAFIYIPFICILNNENMI